MGNPQIVFSTTGFTFPELLDNLVPRRHADALVSVSHGAVTERVRQGYYDEVEFWIENHGDEAFHRKLTAWYAWASRGKQWSLLADGSGRSVATALSAPASAGATSVTVADATGISSGVKLRLRSLDLLSEEIVVCGTPSGLVVPVTGAIVAGTTYAYAAGDQLLDLRYWPKLILLDMDTPFTENPSLTYSLHVRAREDRA